MNTHIWKPRSNWGLIVAAVVAAGISTGAQEPRSATLTVVTIEGKQYPVYPALLPARIDLPSPGVSQEEAEYQPEQRLMDPLSRPANPRTAETDAPPKSGRLVLTSSSPYLADGFAWAKRTALSKVHPDNGGCYQAALPDRGGYCQRDFVHQIDGAALLGLHRENLAMLRQFASHQTEARGWFTLWEINYDGSAMACDYRDDQHFWRNTAGMFDLIHGAYRQYLWTANPALVEDPILHGFYSRTVNEFVAAHDRDGNGIVEGQAATGWGIACTYNEMPGIVLAESADSLGTQRRAFDAYARFLQARGDHAGAEGWAAKAERLRRIFNDTWYDVAAGRYRIGLDHPGRRPVTGFGYETSWFIPYTGLCEPGACATAYLDFIHDRFQAKPSPNIEAWTYLPDVFYSWNQKERGWRYFRHVLDSRSRYPEVSFTVISHIATRILGIEPDAPRRAVTTLGRLPAEVAWAQLDHVPVGGNNILVRHEDGNRTTTLVNHAGPDLTWEALFPGEHAVLLVDDAPQTPTAKAMNGTRISGVTLKVKTGQRRTVKVPEAKTGFRASTGEFGVAYQPGDEWISIRRTSARGSRELRWIPGGGGSALPLLDRRHLQFTTNEVHSSGQSCTLRGQLGWAAYALGVELPGDTPGLIHCWIEVTPREPRGPDQNLFADAGPEFTYADSKGGAVDPEPVFYFETPVTHPVKIWDWRSDLNQLVYFGDRRVLDASVLSYTDFTALNDYFAASGTRMFKRITGWENHEDIVARPAGALGTAKQLPFRFGLQIPPARQALATNRTYRLSDTWLHLLPGAPPPQPTPETARRFLEGYAALFDHVRKPEPGFHPWHEWTSNLISQLSRRRDTNWVWWTLASPHFNFLPYSDYLARFSPQQSDRLEVMGRKHLLTAYAPDYTNNFGSRGGYGWYPTRKQAAKADFWQGYLWPLYIANEYALTRTNAEVRKMVLNLPGVLLDLGRRLDYTFAVFVDLNAATNVTTGYDYDYGVAGLYAVLMLQYHRLTGEAKYLEEAQRAARKLTSFGFCAGFEMNVTALSTLTLLRLHQLTGDPQFLEGSYVQLATLLKHTWLFNPQYERFQGRDLFALTSARANIHYANGAEEGMIMRYLRRYLEEGEKVIDPRWQALVAAVLRAKAHSWTDALPARHADKSRLHLDKPENWDPNEADGWVPMEPFGYNFDDKKLGFLNECIYGCNLLAEAALMQFHPLDDRTLLYTEGPVVLEKRVPRGWALRASGTAKPMKAALYWPGTENWRIAHPKGSSVASSEPVQGWRWFNLSPQTQYAIQRGP